MGYHDEYRRRTLMGPMTGFATSILDAVAHRHADRDAEARRAQGFSMSADDIAAISFWRSLGFFALGALLFVAGVGVVESRALGSLSWSGIVLAIIGVPMVLAGGFNMLLFCAAKLFGGASFVLGHHALKSIFYSALAFACLAIFLSDPSVLMALYTLPFMFWFIRKAVKARRE